jgi:anti-sigma factor RsiW
MQSAKTEDDKLQMFFDGELAPDEEAAMRRDLESSAEGMAQLRDWEQIRDAMKTVSSKWVGEIDSDALFARIERDISAPTMREPVESAPPVLRVVPGGRERRVWGAVATGFAAAAAIFLAVIAWPAEQEQGVEMARGTEVLKVDFGANAGTIFNVEGGAGESLAVIWIDDEEVGMP